MPATTEDGHVRPELAQAEADVERARERVAQSVMALRNEVVRRTDWREWIAKRPGAFLAGAFVLGFLWGFRRGAAGSDTKLQRRRSWR
jgi:hypothetical protein